MTSNFYIPRSLNCEDRILAEEDLLTGEEIVVLLAEPGAGKSDLLESIAGRLGTRSQRASIFRARSTVVSTSVLVLDALDEVATLDSAGLQEVLVRAEETGARRIILASRSSEWEESRSHFIKDCFGKEPLIARLEPFSDGEQESLFRDYVPDEAFSAFKAELSKFDDLLPLLGNPQFLKLFADAYVESGRSFNTKQEIFASAVRRLTHEANPAYARGTKPSEALIAEWADEVFAKLLLSGSVGVSSVDNLDERHFPHLNFLLSGNHDQASHILNTRLLKPSAIEGQHEHVHRMVAEYCAARYLAKRVQDSTDLLTPRKCLAIVAPNSVVRDELRGLVGWMAALGDKSLQEAVIDLDPYAVLANGDPSQLLPSSRGRLWARLNATAELDPYFRRGDVGRTFSLSGFFSNEVLEDVKSHLAKSPNERGHLRNLLLEMLRGSDAVRMLVPELRELVLNASNTLSTRLLANSHLVAVGTHDHKSDCEELIKQSNDDAIRISVEMFRILGIEILGRDTLLALLRKYADVNKKGNKDRDLPLSGYFVKSLISEMNLCHVVWLLNQLTEGLACNCGAETAYHCNCRSSISKVVGRLLDRYFEQEGGPFDVTKIWQWMKRLNFQNRAAPRAEDSESIRVLRTNHKLRQGIQRHSLEGITDLVELQRIWRDAFGWRGHEGLRFQPKDTCKIVDLAFEANNLALWKTFHEGHSPYRHEHGPNPLRERMRRQARQKSAFMKAWATLERETKLRYQKYWASDRRHRRHMRLEDRRHDQTKANNRQFVEENRALIESGHHWGSLDFFANRYLTAPEELSDQVGDLQIAENALCNCLPFIEPELPTLQQLAALRCESKGWRVVTVLYAACYARFRRFSSLADIKPNTLAILKTDINVSYGHDDTDTLNAFREEVDNRLIQDSEDAERLARHYLEPQVRNSKCKHTDLWWLRSTPGFSPLLRTLPLEWLMRFPGTSLEALETLFELVVDNCDRATVIQLIQFHMQYVENSFFWQGRAENQDLIERRSFWLLRSFYFKKDCPDVVEDWLRTDPNTIFLLESPHNPMYRGRGKGWPQLSADKVFLLLEAYAEAWPKVHLPNSWGTDSPKNERAFRFLKEVVWEIGKDDPDKSLPVLGSIISDPRLGDFHDEALNMRASALRAKALREYRPPSPSQIVKFLDEDQVATVEGLRALLNEVLLDVQNDINGGEFDPIEKFYHSNGRRVNEKTATKRIAEHMKMQLQVLNVSVTLEHQLKNAKRCDITATQMLDGARKLLVTEVKGQWNRELFTAAWEQLHIRYAAHPDAEHQGIYLVLWFGDKTTVAGKKNHLVSSSRQLQERIVESMPNDLQDLIDVFVLDLSREH